MLQTLARVNQQTARYTPAGGAEKCAQCRFFMPQGFCGRVIGPVSPRGWCKYYSREAVQRWSNPGYAGSGGGLPAGATLSLNFMTGALDPLITFTRASTGTYFDATGTMQTAALNAPRWDYDPVTHALRGVLLEDQRTNALRNNTNTGAVVGTPGTVPNAWSIVTAGGLTTNVAALGTDANGLRYIDLRISGTTAGGTYRLAFDSTSGIPAVQNQVWTTSGYASLVAGSLTGLAGFVAGLGTYTSGAVLLTFREVSVAAPSGAALVAQRFAATATASDATTAFARPTYSFTVAAATVDATIRIAGMQMELGDFATSFIATSAAAVTRSIDGCLIPSANMGFFTGSPGGSWFAEFDYFDATPTAGNRIVLQADVSNASANVMLQASNQVGQYDGGVVLIGPPAAVANSVTKAATTWAVGQAKNSTNGGAVVSSSALITGYGVLSATGVRFMTGLPALSTGTTSGHIRRVAYWPRVLADAELQQVTT